MKAKILVIEDRTLIRDDLQNILESEDYQVVTAHNDDTALEEMQKELTPTLALVDFKLKNSKKNGAETVKELLQIRNIPIIYVTAYTDAKTTNLMKKTRPVTIIPKPYSSMTISLAVDCALDNFRAQEDENVPNDTGILYLKNAGDSTVHQIKIGDIYYVIADGSYVRIYTATRVYRPAMNLKKLLKRIQVKQSEEQPIIFQIHRSCAINLYRFKELATDYVTFERPVDTTQEKIPISDSYRKTFLKQIKKEQTS